MSPLRRWMTEHRLPSWYSWVVVVLVPVMASTAVLIVSLRTNQRSIERERAAREQSQVAFCNIVILLDDSYHQTPPKLDSGKKLAKAISTARVVNHCPPYKEN